jgi:hypothetical protein
VHPGHHLLAQEATQALGVGGGEGHKKPFAPIPTSRWPLPADLTTAWGHRWPA